MSWIKIVSNMSKVNIDSLLYIYIYIYRERERERERERVISSWALD